ncbi:MAG: DNA-3-methyladenine glycosylase 2 family protein, partial [Bacteroidales bacterium]|nr:DNA-3-methyladenine glycosylase 2 family protein [Bacteroidales bacterium]
ARNTIWKRIENKLNKITPTAIHNLPVEDIQQFGISFRKANYIKSAAQKITNGELNLNSLYKLSDKEVRNQLTQLNGVGIWTAEMLMIFSMQRPNILSYGDLAIHRGLQILYQQEKIDKDTFNEHWKRYTPYASVASLYLWEIASGNTLPK